MCPNSFMGWHDVWISIILRLLWLWHLFWSYISLNSKVQWQRQMKQLSTFKKQLWNSTYFAILEQQEIDSKFFLTAWTERKKIKFLSCLESLTTARQSRDRKGIKLGERERENKPWCIPLWLAQSTVTWKRSIFDPILLAFISATIRRTTKHIINYFL